MPSVKALKQMANNLRIDSIRSTTAAGSGHPTSCMSCAEVMSCLFFSEMKDDDEFILSKGHAAPILWSAYAESGFIKKKDLLNLRKITSPLEGHPTPLMPLIKVASGSLGQGLSAGVGMAAGKRLAQSKARVYVIMGDGECAEGSVWEAANAAAHYKLNNICAIVDVNRLGQTQPTMHAHKVKVYSDKFKAFGWNTAVIDGHNIKSVLSAMKRARKSTKPFAIISKSFKGKGFSEVENKNGFHGKAFDRETAERAIAEIGESKLKLRSKLRPKRYNHKFMDFKPNLYKKGEIVATRVAFGNALVKLGKRDKKIVTLDGDVKNSTMTQGFFENFPERSFESYIAEQNMVGMGIGLSGVGFTPFMSTFATFFTRAHDFIRMAHYSKADIKFVGSHVGVSIGEDGPSQMGLEDIPMFLSMPDSLILYPCDAVSTEKCVREMAKHVGISYLRTTREKTPVLYNNTESFPAGKFKVLRKSTNDKVLVIGSGETVHEALKAYDELKAKGTNIRVIDLYSIRPIDEKGLQKEARQCKNKVILVEDHYFGGIGSVVCEAIGKVKHLYVKKTPRSGKPEQLRRKYQIDSAAIVKAVKEVKIW